MVSSGGKNGLLGDITREKREEKGGNRDRVRREKGSRGEKRKVDKIILHVPETE